MKPEDQAVFDALYRSHSSFFEERGILVSFADYMAGFEAACAHRDAQPAVAVNEQMLEALKLAKEELLLSGFLTIPLIDAAIEQAEAQIKEQK